MVKYLNQGASFVIKARRDDAYKKMYKLCNGRYKIVSEGPEKGSQTVAVPFGDAWVAASTEYWVIKFECE